jgi:hypothetical protein
VDGLPTCDGGEKEAAVEQQKIPNEEAAIYSLMACQEMTEARLECEEPTSVVVESEAVHEEFHTEEAAVKSSETKKKLHRSWHLAAGQRGEKWN